MAPWMVPVIRSHRHLMLRASDHKVWLQDRGGSLGAPQPAESGIKKREFIEIAGRFSCMERVGPMEVESVATME